MATPTQSQQEITQNLTAGIIVLTTNEGFPGNALPKNQLAWPAFFETLDTIDRLLTLSTQLTDI